MENRNGAEVIYSNWVSDRTEDNTIRALFVLKGTLKLLSNETNAGLLKANQIAATKEAANAYRLFEEIERSMKNKTYLTIEISKENIYKLTTINEFLHLVNKKYPQRHFQMAFTCIMYLQFLFGNIYNQGVRNALYRREAAAAGGSGDESPKTPVGGARKTRKQKRRARTQKKSKKTRRY
jgi:hypothetical protein